MHSKQRKEHSTRPNREAVHFLLGREAMHNATVVPSQKPNIVLKEAVPKVHKNGSAHKEKQLGQTMVRCQKYFTLLSGRQKALVEMQ